MSTVTLEVFGQSRHSLQSLLFGCPVRRPVSQSQDALACATDILRLWFLRARSARRTASAFHGVRSRVSAAQAGRDVTGGSAASGPALESDSSHPRSVRWLCLAG